MYYQSNKEYLGPFYLLKIYLTKYFFKSDSFIFKQVDNIRDTVPVSRGLTGSKFFCPMTAKQNNLSRTGHRTIIIFDS